MQGRFSAKAGREAVKLECAQEGARLSCDPSERIAYAKPAEQSRQRARVRLRKTAGAGSVITDKDFRDKGEWPQVVARSTGDCQGMSAGSWRAKSVASRVSTGDQETRKMFIELLLHASHCVGGMGTREVQDRSHSSGSVKS